MSVKIIHTTTPPHVGRESVHFARGPGEASAELTVYGLAAVVRTLDEELCSGSPEQLDGGHLVGLAIAARILADNLADRIGNCPAEVASVAA